MPETSVELDSERIIQAEQVALDYLLSQQKKTGDFEGEMVWCTMILAQAVIVRTIMGRPYHASEREKIILHFEVTQATDGSWGMHPESPGYIFFTTLAYVALRLLNVAPEEGVTRRARQWLHGQKVGVEGIPTWGKFWLAIIGLYEYEGLNAIPPELFLLPEWLPFHPKRFYCHTRLIYLGLAYISGKRFVATLPQALVADLRRELYLTPYERIPFSRLRHKLAPGDVYVPITPVLRLIYDGLAIFERWHGKKLREKALRVCMDRIEFEQKSTRHQGISPVNGLLNTLALYIENPLHPELEASLAGVEAWRWVDEKEGLRYVGARSNTWDTGFVLQAIAEISNPEFRTVDAMTQAVEFLDRAQMTEETQDYQCYWRDPALGGWCFSDGEHRWPVSDCTAEALSGLIALYEHPGYASLPRLPSERLRNGIRFILSRQNADGGFGTYERRRAGKLLELINPSEMFGQCMTELSYIECTASSLGAISHFRIMDPDFEAEKLENAAQRAISLLKGQQKPDGSWQGFWGINYTYATFHVARALRLAGINANDESLQRAANFLKSHQRADGGWSEHYTSCLEERYIEQPETQVVMTSWALLGLLEVLPPNDPAIQRGFLWLLSKQLPDGSWPMQSVNGVFFGAAMLDYRLYHTYFPVWAITRYNHTIKGV
jgi:2,3-oxidosqualene cyclase